MQCQFQQYWGGPQWSAGTATLPPGAISFFGPDGSQVLQMPAQQMESHMSLGNTTMNGCMSPCNGNGSVQVQVDLSDCGSPLHNGPISGSPVGNGFHDNSPVFHSPLPASVEADGSPVRNGFHQPVFHTESAKDTKENGVCSINSPSRRGYGYAEAWRTPSSAGSPALSGCNTEAPPSPRQGNDSGSTSVPTGPSAGSSSHTDDEGCWLGTDPARELLRAVNVQGPWAHSSTRDEGKGKGKKHLKHLKGGDVTSPQSSFNHVEAADPAITQDRLMSLPWV